MKIIKSIAIMLAFAFFVVSCSDHSVRFKVEPQSVVPGGKGSVLVKLCGGGKWHIDPKSLISIRYTAPAGIKMDVEEFFCDNHPSNTNFRTWFKVNPDASKGPAKIKAEVFFMVCSKSLCKMIKEEHEGSVQIR